MNSLDSKGQVGEDIVHIVVSVFFIAVILYSLNYAFTSRLLDSMETDLYERGWILAEVAATRWACNDSSGIQNPGILDRGKICTGCIVPEGYRVSYVVKDLTDEGELCKCGQELNESKAVKLPAAVGINYKETHLGVIEVLIDG